MIGAQTLARPYAKAVFDLALEEKALAEWLEVLTALAVLVRLPEMRSVIHDPLIMDEDKASIVLKLLDDDKPQLKNFLQLLIQNNRLSLAPQILNLFIFYKSQFEHELKVTVTTAYELKDAQIEKLSEALEHKFLHKLAIATEVDASILGGVVIRVGDQVIDGSGRGALATLENYLKGSQVCN